MITEVTHRSSRPGLPPVWRSVLAVIAHPDDASSGLGSILDAFVFAGTRVEVLCLTHGQAWSLHGAPGDLAALRGSDLASAADVLGATRVKMEDGLDGVLGEACQRTLSDQVVAAAASCRPDGLLVFDTTPAPGHHDHVAATAAGLLAAETLHLPVLGWTLPDSVSAQLNQEPGTILTSSQHENIDLRVTVDRARARLAAHVNVRKALPGSVRSRRLELLADTECLRWLRPAVAAVTGPATLPRQVAQVDAVDGRPIRAEHRGGDKFAISVRGHVIAVDQPVKDGGDDTAPTPTELFIASLASCVAFYARRYLARHDLPTEGLAVEASFATGVRPARVAAIELRLIVPEGVPAERRDPLLAVATHCTVHNTLARTPAVSITLTDAPYGLAVSGSGVP